MRITRISEAFTTRRARNRRRAGAAGCAVLAGLAVLVLVSAAPAAAQPVPVLAIVTSFDQLLNNARDWLVGILAGLATVCLTIAGARYLLGGNDPAEIEKAKTALRAACIGYVLAMLAPVVVEVLKSLVGA
ncbi:pilin [Nocardia wallacei]|uniref:pilin n=1 Tax=Nocardia wallacei TaxID=480035 RepID=UPI0024588B8A|nr:pilin [Nocardia wallacei]